VGAIVVRTTLTLVVVALLKIPVALLFAGGLLLRCVSPTSCCSRRGEAATTAANCGEHILGALRTVVIADTVMGLDNVLAVAGAAHGSFLLVRSASHQHSRS
jgi:predicted tellurium resistance membrane protein TerC